MCVSCKGGLVKKRRKSGKTGIVGQTAEHYPMEDRVLKAAARFMGEELLPLLVLEGVVKRVAPTEAVFLEVKDFLADFNYEMADGTWKRLEFESDSISTEGLKAISCLGGGCQLSIQDRGIHLCAVLFGSQGFA